MANEEQLSILKQGVEVWNRWREENPELEIDLSGADLQEANLTNANLQRANLKDANLSNAILVCADLSKADLTIAALVGVNLHGAWLIETKLEGAELLGTNLSRANLQRANLKQTNLRGNIIVEADLSGSDLSWAWIGDTIFAHTDLTEVIGLDRTEHWGPSSISVETIRKFNGYIPENFLRGCGLSDWEIAAAKLYNPELSNDERNKILYEIYDLQAHQAIQVSPLFISYNHADHEFVDKIGDQLTERGIRYWRDIHDMKAGRIEKQIDRAIRQNPTVLLILSQHSLKSDWVEHEVRKAREIAKNAGRDTLCPVALDDSWKKSPWPAHVMEQITEYNILDFSEWEDDSKFEGMFRKLIDGLELFYKG